MSSTINHKKRSSRKSHNRIPVNMFANYAMKVAQAKLVRSFNIAKESNVAE